MVVVDMDLKDLILSMERVGQAMTHTTVLVLLQMQLKVVQKA